MRLRRPPVRPSAGGRPPCTPGLPAYLEALGVRVLCVAHERVLRHGDEVAEAIREAAAR
jgi:hypothetical protein